MRIGNRNQSFEWYHFQWPWTTPNVDFKVAIFFNIQQLENGNRQSCTYKGRPIVSRAASLRQMSFLHTRSLSDALWNSVIVTRWSDPELTDGVYEPIIKDRQFRIYIIWSRRNRPRFHSTPVRIFTVKVNCRQSRMMMMMMMMTHMHAEPYT